VRGIHQGTGQVHGSKHRVSRSVSSIYPAATWIVADLKRRKAVNRERLELDSRLSPVTISGNRFYDRIRDADLYVRLMDRLQAEFKEKQERAAARKIESSIVPFSRYNTGDR
jgi:hypothetical protein